MNAPTAAKAELLPGTFEESYTLRAGLFDEMRAPDGEVRPHWSSMLRSLSSLGRPELLHRWEEARHLIRENGVTYNVYGDPRGMERPWQLDPVPLMVSTAEAAVLEAGLIQRARLLELILADLYGPQRLLHDGLLPPELVFANSAFLRPCHGIRLTGRHYLHLYAANIGRAADGNFWVISDRTQAPSGAGYALENRIVLTRMLPDAFAACQVQRLALFFRTFQDTLRSVAPHNRDNPRVVLLTPGPYNETYFEHAYLARYLGYPLVEGGDLTVRGQQVFVKALEGLMPVDVIVRRLDGDYCDPLELRPDSFLGVPGMVQAVRAGNVTVANALGSGLVETPALLAFLPGLCQYLLGEELQIPSVATWWCGAPPALNHVLANLANMVIKPAFPKSGLKPIFANRLTDSQRKTLADRLRARPHYFVGQEPLPLSTAPVLVGDRLEPRQVVLRVYLAASDDTFVAMPGGLTRVTANADTMNVSMQEGGGSKDTWVLASGPVCSFSLLQSPNRRFEVKRADSELSSRAADNLFWLGRYAERAEGMTRLLRGILTRLMELSGLADVPELPLLLRALTRQCHAYPGFVGEGADSRIASPAEELLSLIFDLRRAGSVASNLQSVVQIAARSRDRISTDMWRVLYGRDLRGLLEAKTGNGTPTTKDHTLSEGLDLLDRLILTLAAFGGLASESMTRGHGWRFLDMGRKLERALHTIGLLRNLLGTAQSNDGPVLQAVLEIADSSMTYRRRYSAELEPAAVLDLLLADETNPRSLASQLAALADDIDHLPDPTEQPGRSQEQRLVLTGLTAVRLAYMDQLANADHSHARQTLQELLDQLTKVLPELSDVITQRYLSHLQMSRHLGGQESGGRE